MSQEKTEGWIILKKSLLDWECFQVPDALNVFVYLLLKASFADGKVSYIKGVRNGKVKTTKPISRGQLCTTIEQIAIDLGYGSDDESKKRVKTALDAIENAGSISMVNKDQRRWITITNYNKHQTICGKKQQKPEEKPKEKPKESQKQKRMPTW